MAAMVRLSVRHFSCARGPALLSNQNAFESKSVYPAILPSTTAKSRSAKQRRVAEFFDQLRGSNVKDKLSSLTKLQRMKYVVYPQTFALNADKWYQHFTKTAYISELPEKYSMSAHETEKSNTLPQIDAAALAEIRTLVCNSLLQENCQVRKGRAPLLKELQYTVAPFLKNLSSGMTCVLAKQNPLLRSSTFDSEPQVNFYWLRGKRILPKGHRRGRPEPTRFQIDDKPHCQLRIPHQLPEFVPLRNEVSEEVPVVHLSPDRLPLFRRQYENHVYSGAKVDDPCCYGHTQFHLMPERLNRDRMSELHSEKQLEVTLRANAIASLFAWTGAQAMYQGFWSNEDLDRPFVSQAVITDGQYFSFFCYQLNTLALTDEAEVDNPRKNLCWGTKSMQLYENITDNDVIGLNDQVLRLLIQFLLNGA
ncbi:39S ribosomal protein S30, mitochondrial [Clupea harengus]|uniref:39S ribosomal protein S30, mitochondrial n=1 Tax=Clupea harengus TaxID=7950 RepID=A0A8M1KF89_CLUHA|nr:39S ribosomal protein S30, mitochondrial [Clupea harengus]